MGQFYIITPPANHKGAYAHVPIHNSCTRTAGTFARGNVWCDVSVWSVWPSVSVCVYARLCVWPCTTTSAHELHKQNCSTLFNNKQLWYLSFYCIMPLWICNCTYPWTKSVLSIYLDYTDMEMCVTKTHSNIHTMLNTSGKILYQIQETAIFIDCTVFR